MKTPELVQLLARDSVHQRPPAATLWRLFVPAGLVSVGLFLLVAGLRPDLDTAIATPRFNFKLLMNLVLWIAATGLLLRLARPVDPAGGWRIALWLAGVALLLAVLAELWLLPRESWWLAARGRNATWCLRIIPALGAVPLLAALLAMRRAAPARPVMAGAAAGLMSAGFAGFLYAMHCPDDSPLFVGIWYGLAGLVLTGCGALAGSRMLRW